MKNTTLETVKQAIRAGYAWPGGYCLLVLMNDGESLCIQCARENYGQIARDTVRGSRSGWCASRVYVHWEGSAEHCAHCNKVLPSEYGDPEEGTESC
jgi:hypothetical protein